MAQTDEERQASNVDALTAPEQATPGAAVLRGRPVLVAVLDSGATIHMVSDGQFLSKIRHLRYPLPIRVADGRAVYAYAVGDIDTEDIKLKNVYVVRDLKMNLVSIHELAKIGIVTTFYKNHAELRKGAEVVGGAVVEGDKSLYKLTYLWATGDGDASNTTPEVPSGSEPGMVAAVYGSNLPRLREDVYAVYGSNLPRLREDVYAVYGSNLPRLREDVYAVYGGNLPRLREDVYGSNLPPLETLDDLADEWAKYYPENWCRMSPSFKSLDDTAAAFLKLKPKYSHPFLVSKFYESDKTDGLDDTTTVYSPLVSDKTSGLDGTAVYSALVSKFYQSGKTGGFDDTAVYSAFPKPEYSHPSLVSKFYQSDKTGGGECCNIQGEANFIKSLKD